MALQGLKEPEPERKQDANLRNAEAARALRELATIAEVKALYGRGRQKSQDEPDLGAIFSVVESESQGDIMRARLNFGKEAGFDADKLVSGSLEVLDADKLETVLAMLKKLEGEVIQALREKNWKRDVQKHLRSRE